MRFRTGPLAWTPTIQIKNVGVDTNVFNAVEDPKQDYTFTAGPQIDWWLRAGNARLHGTNGADGVYFQEYESERSINQSHKLTLELPLNRIKPYVGGSYLDTKDRPGFEIDARARHTELDARGGIVISLSARTRIDLSGFERKYEFTGDDELEGTYLAEVLNRKTRGGTGQILFAVTPLTTLTLTGETGQERFNRTPERDNNSFRIMPGVTFDPDALLKGSLHVGYRKLNMTSPAIPDFEGVVARGSISYVLLGRTRFTVSVDRDVQFSFETTSPYYLSTGVGGAVRLGLARGFDIEARGAEQRLQYRKAVDAEASVADRLDKVRTWGGAIGYTASRGTRLSLNADYFQRRSPVYGRDYEGLRAGLAVSVGF